MTDQLSFLPILDDAEIEKLDDCIRDYSEETKTLVIADLDMQRREDHQKYKRCLANAEACMHKRWRPDEGFDYARSTRHMNKWLELAETFKTKSNSARCAGAN